MSISVIDCVPEFKRHYRKWNDCNDCGLGEKAGRHVLRPRGYTPCDLLFVGMAPGPSENRIGLPMVGPTAEIIDGWILESGVYELRWAIQNLTACISRDGPMKVRNPLPYEIRCCKPRLVEIVRMLSPGQIVLLGELAQKHFPKDDFRECQYLNLPHPIFLVRGEKKNVDVGLINSRAISELKQFAFGA